MRFDGIIFDLDGTLWDASSNIAASWRTTLLKRFHQTENIPSVAEVKSIMGLGAEQIAARLFQDLGADPKEIFQTCAEEECPYLSVHGGDIYPGVEQMLAALSARYPLFIASNCQKGYIESFFQFSGFEKFFQDHICEGDTGLSKAENIRILADRNGISAPVYVGDTAADEASAEKANCPFIHVTYGFGTAGHPMASVDSPTGLMRALQAAKD